MLNKENEHELEQIDMVEDPLKEISGEEAQRALNGMKSGKALGPTGLAGDSQKKAGIIGELPRILRYIVENGKIPEESKNSVTVPIYKRKGDALDCGKYKGIRLLEHVMKLFEKVLKEIQRKLIKVDDRQFGFCS